MTKYLVLVAVVVSAVLAGVTRMTLADGSGDASRKAAVSHIGHFRHVVLFAFKEGTPRDKVVEIEEAFAALKHEIPSIIDYEWGLSESVERKNDGFTHCFLLTFQDKAGLQAYISSVPHQAFVKILEPHLEKAVVFDYTAGE